MEKFEYMELLTQAGFTLIPLQGHSKLPTPNFQNTTYEMEVDRSKFPANYGVLLQDEILVVDVDPRNFEAGDKPHVRLFEDIKLDLKASTAPVVRTGSGGLHIFFRKPNDCHTREKIKEYRGIDFKSTSGRFMVGPGSIHPDTRKTYDLLRGDFLNIPDAPTKLLNMLKSSGRKRTHDTKALSAEELDSPGEIDRYTQFLEAADPAIEGDSGDQQTYNVACRGYSYGLSPEKTYELMAQIYNPRCLPPWDLEGLWSKVESAFKSAQGEAGELKAEKEASFKKIDISVMQKGHMIKWNRTDKGALKATIQNCVNFFILENSELSQTIAYDEFQGEVKIIKPLPWHKKAVIPSGGTLWSDEDTVQCRFYLNHKFGFDPNSKLLDEGVLVAAHFFKLHPVRDFLEGLVWDKTPRLHNWLSTYAGVPENVYSRDVSRKVLVQAVARVFQPGVKVDNVVILEGKQGIGKSSLVSIIGGKWYADIVVDPHSRDTVDAMRGKWIIEFSEMEVTRRADAQALKAFITRQTDRVRLAYGRRSIDYPRQCIFMGTINPDATREYLTDDTGNRRYWPVVCGQVRFRELERDRDQLLAEAVETYYRGETLFVEDKHVMKLMEVEQAGRLVSDPWTESIENFLSSNEFVQEHNFTTTNEIWEYALRGAPTLFSKHHANRICAIMRKLGWDYVSSRHPLHKTKVMKAFKWQGITPWAEETEEKQPSEDIFS